ncbi:hypothetical protein G4B88_026837 [Cannabis sativa]|uniref:Ubiquitin-like protease family profile domain-containing protein n=1 Tax=Cannabis sativa TaxID=3483 RepID=A0A7J6DPJ8_CANSA|nr:hypothetical protein G4B88_026837 [Cannabis sativa]
MEWKLSMYNEQSNKSSQQINLFVRKKIKQDDTLNQMITTTDCLFDQVIWNSYNQFLKSGSNPSKIDFDNVIPRYIDGEYLFCNTPWVLTDYVLIYVNIQKQKHWILVHFDIKERMMNVYNSMSGALNKKRALDHVKAYSTMLPFYLEYLNVYSSRPDLNLVQGPYSVGKREPLNFKFIDGLPSQVNSDCGVFVIKFAKFFIRGKIDDIPAKMSDLVAVYKDDLAVSLFIHARRKQIGGYITDDEVLKKGKKSKDNASVKAKISVRNWFFMMIKKQLLYLVEDACSVEVVWVDIAHRLLYTFMPKPVFTRSVDNIILKTFKLEMHIFGVLAEVVSSKKRKVVSDDASASKKSKTKDAVEDSNLDKVCESNVVDDEKVANVAKKVKKKPVSKSHGKKKSETPAVDAPLRFAGKPQLYNPFNVIHDINENLSDNQKELFRKSPFGHFLDLTHLVLLRHIHTERDDVELWFNLGNKAVRFGIEELSLITGLDCKKSYDVDLFKSKKLLGYKEDIFYMHGLTEKVTVREVASVFFSGALKDDEDYVKIALVYFFAGYLYGYPKGKKIDNFIFSMINVDDFIEVFNRFGWGKLLWEKTFYHLKIALKDGNDTFEQLAKKRMIEKGYKLKGFLIVFLIWLYEIIPSLSPSFCKRIGNKSPRVLNWENSPTSEFSELIQDVFNNPKFDPQYIPKRVDDAVCSDEVNDEVKVSHEKLDHICVELNSIKEC